MREQGSNAWGLTVSRRFETAEQAAGAADGLKQAGFREDQIRVWQHRRSGGSGEDRLARTVEGLLAGGFISGLAGFFLGVAISWTGDDRIAMEAAAGYTVVSAAAGAIVTAIAVNLISTRFAFSHPHQEAPAEPPSVVTVTVGDRATEAKQVFDRRRA